MSDIKSNKKRKGGLRRQVLKSILAALLVAMAFTGICGVIISLSFADSENSLSQRMIERAGAIFREYNDTGTITDGGSDEDSEENVGVPWNIEIIDPDGNIVYAKKPIGNFPTDIIISNPIDGVPGGQVVISASLGQTRSMYFLVALALGMIVFSVVFSLMFRKIERYTYEIADGIDVLAGGDLDCEIPVRGSTELSMLSANINAMAATLKQRSEEKLCSDKARDDLIVNVAHDFRTPITVLEGYLGLLAKDADCTSRDEYINISLEKCKELDARANAIFEFVRLNGEAELNKNAVTAASYFSEKFEEIAMVLGQEQVHCDVCNLINPAIKIYIDKDKTGRVFDNLLSNILKYADFSQTVTMNAEMHGDFAVVKITNGTERAIPLDETTMFERMVSGDKSRSSGSAGLGLSICKVIMLKHKGEISAEITGNTITFTLRFPCMTDE